jgi:hypothetical protein
MNMVSYRMHKYIFSNLFSTQQMSKNRRKPKLRNSSVLCERILRLPASCTQTVMIRVAGGVSIQIDTPRSMSKVLKQRRNQKREKKKPFQLIFQTGAAQMYLAIPASSAPSERVFSGAGYVFSKRRQAMLAEKLSSIVFIRENCDDEAALRNAFESAKKMYKNE